MQSYISLNPLAKFFYKLYYWFNPPEMVKWWKTKTAVRAKLTTATDGSYIMLMEGEKYAFPGYPRGHLLYGTLSKLKHEIKNQIFNENWHRLERTEPVEITQALKNIYELAKVSKFDMIPVEKSAPAVRELIRALPTKEWKDILGYIFQEDDAYRFRFQWLASHLSKKDPFGSFDRGMYLLEHAEITPDMRERVRLIRRVLLALWKDPYYGDYWVRFVRDLDLKKVQLSKADKYFFRAKYFRVDYPYLQY